MILFTYPTLTILIGVLFMGKSLHRSELLVLLLFHAGNGLRALSGFPTYYAERLERRSVHCNTVDASWSYLSGSADDRCPAMRHRAGDDRCHACGASAFVSQPLAAYLLPLRTYAYVAAIVAFNAVLPMFMTGVDRVDWSGTLGADRHYRTGADHSLRMVDS